MRKGKIITRTFTDPNYLFADTGLNKNCLHIVPSQEMIQGHRSVGTYAADFAQGGWQLLTTKALENAFYGDWLGAKDSLCDKKLQQIVEVGEMLAELEPDRLIPIKQSCGTEVVLEIDENLRQSMEHNTASMVEALRKFSELGLQPDGIALAGLSTSQLIVVYLYQQICRNPDSSFKFNRLHTRQQVEEALDRAVSETISKRFAANKSKQKQALAGYENLSAKDTIIFDSVFQLTPTLLSAIFDLRDAGYTVYLLYNYRTEPELRPFYECWMDMYRLFDSAEFKVNTQLHPPVNPENYKLAMALGSVASGRYPAEYADALSRTKFFEFSSVTEYANYVDRSFREALETEKAKTQKIYQNTLHYMPEMHYAASRKATSILRAYHPQQFGDRTLLDYPLGKCLAALVKMWNPEKWILEIKNMGLLGDCLRGYPSPDMDCLTNVNTFNTLRSCFDSCTTLDEVIAITGRILGQKENSTENVPFACLSLHQVTVQELTGFLHTLQQMNETARLLFACTEERVEFYEKIKGVMELLLGQESLDEKSRDMYAASLKSLLMRAKDLLEEIPDEQSPSTVSTENKQLRMMLNEILNITETDSSSAKWIIHDLVQIDGDILVQPAPGISRTNHFGFLSDQDLCGNPDDLLPWPLDMRFFDNVVLEDQSHTIFRIYRQSILSSLDFPKYALIYGLLFSRDPVTLSYVKQVGCNDKGKDREPYYLFRLLGLKPHRIALENDCKSTDLSPYAYQSDTAETEYHETLAEDSYPAQICTFRYIAERLISRKTCYADRFSMVAYIKSCLMYLVLKSMVLYDGDQFLPESLEALHTIVRNAASEVFGGEDFGKLCSLGFLTESELHEIRHDVTHQSQIRAYKIIKCICKKLYNSITAENPRQAFLLEPEARILDNADVQSITQKDPDGSTVRILDRAAYLRKAVENYGKNTALYPNDSAFFESTEGQQNPQQLWMTNNLYDRYANFDVHKTTDRNGDKERFSCSLCTCKPFCPHGLTSIT